ncbi:hypothetical protein SAY86_002421 [Trapa natans]|uniref:Uncharacterized protein n=1 Tax=Trapa natans TaxID=22666 RepID=A0AAN7R0L6_TRANT|nr:hypothetical protein SAY86_002421 [Trapa natans]
MASPAVGVSFHVALAVLVVLVLFYVGRPLCWKITATVHDIRHNKQILKHGRRSSSLLEDHRHRPRHPPQQADPQAW